VQNSTSSTRLFILAAVVSCCARESPHLRFKNTSRSIPCCFVRAHGRPVAARALGARGPCGARPHPARGADQGLGIEGEQKSAGEAPPLVCARAPPLVCAAARRRTARASSKRSSHEKTNTHRTPRTTTPPKKQQSLSYGILAGACLTKLPQILSITGARSARGLSAAAFELESAGLAIHAAYGALHGLPFTAYGEALILLAQNLVILALVYHYGRMGAARGVAVAGALASAAALLFAGVVGRSTMAAIYSANSLVTLASRLPQIYANYKAGSTGQLALATYAVNVVGGGARVFTSLHEKAGGAMVRAYALSLALNAAIVAQILLYGSEGQGPLGSKAGRRRAGSRRGAAGAGAAAAATPARMTRAAAAAGAAAAPTPRKKRA
jgi:mannose-P-dolichol utilization defect protein 1